MGDNQGTIDANYATTGGLIVSRRHLPSSALYPSLTPVMLLRRFYAVAIVLMRVRQ